MSEVVDEPSGELARLTGLSYDDLEEADEGTIRDAMAIMDPAFQVRTERTANATIKLLTDVMNSIEPSYRAGLSRAYAVRFTEAELGELGAFFSTPTGAHYAAESMLIYTDPQVMSAMSEMMPAMFDMMPEMTSAMEEASSGLQAPRKYSELNKSEQARISRILGVSRKELLESEPTEYAEAVAEMAGDAAEEAADVMENATEM